jgi:hypothetical protein
VKKRKTARNPCLEIIIPSFWERHRLSEYGQEIAKKYKYENLVTEDGSLDSKSYYHLLKVSRRFRFVSFKECPFKSNASLFMRKALFVLTVTHIQK